MAEYSEVTGVSRSIAKGRAKYHRALLKAFARHLLHEAVDVQRLIAPTRDLSARRTGFDVPQAQADGLNVLQAQLERYLVSPGIPDRGQTLSAEVEPPAAEIVDGIWRLGSLRLRHADRAYPSTGDEDLPELCQRADARLTIALPRTQDGPWASSMFIGREP